jgi:UPF0271 protein
MVDKIFILDTSVFILGYDIRDMRAVTVPEVADELLGKKKVFLDIAVKKGLRIKRSREESIKRVKKIAKETGDIEKLSSTDISLLAKAIDCGKDAIVLSDDYAIQNVCSKFGMRFKGIQQGEIKRDIIWKKRCVGCKRIYEKGDICPICGSKLKIKVVKKGERHK